MRKSAELRELERHRDIAQRAVSVTSFLGIHGFLPDVQCRLMAARVSKYIRKYNLGLVDKGFKDYAVLLPGARLGKKWTVILLPGKRERHGASIKRPK